MFKLLHLTLLSGLVLTACQSMQAPVIRPDDPAAQQQSTSSHSSVDFTSELAPMIKEVSTGSDLGRYYVSGILEKGAINAPLQLAIFTEYHCPYCADFKNDHLVRLEEDFIEDGHLRVVMIPSVINKYPNSAVAIKGLLCAGAQGALDRMDGILTSRSNKHRSSLLEYAEELALDKESFETCLDAPETQEKVDALVRLAENSDVSLYPTLFFENTKMTGLPYYADLKAMISAKVTSR